MQALNFTDTAKRLGAHSLWSCIVLLVVGAVGVVVPVLMSIPQAHPYQFVPGCLQLWALTKGPGKVESCSNATITRKAVIRAGARALRG
jgi:hypothetical protein